MEAPLSTTTQTIFSADGLTIAGSCDASGNITVDATGPNANNGELRIQGNTAVGGALTSSAFFQNVFNFGSASAVSLVSTDGAKTEGSGQLVYATNDGHVLTFDYGFDFGSTPDSAYDLNWPGCTLYGEVVYS